MSHINIVLASDSSCLMTYLQGLSFAICASLTLPYLFSFLTNLSWRPLTYLIWPFGCLKPFQIKQVEY